MGREFGYPVTLLPDDEAGGFAVSFVDFPEAITQGDDRADALAQAADALEEAIAGRIRRGEDIPEPSVTPPGGCVVACPASTASKAALHLAIREARVSLAELAARLGSDEKHVARLLDPRQPAQMRHLQDALAALGKRLTISMFDERAA